MSPSDLKLYFDEDIKQVFEAYLLKRKRLAIKGRIISSNWLETLVRFVHLSSGANARRPNRTEPFFIYSKVSNFWGKAKERPVLIGVGTTDAIIAAKLLALN